jgi:putative component of toxin-antitoxin plasmid stabilization module
LCGGNKSTRETDIAKAKELAKEPLEKEEKDENR